MLHILKTADYANNYVRVFPIEVPEGAPIPDGEALYNAWVESWDHTYPDSDDDFCEFLKSKGYTIPAWTDETILT